MRFIAILAFLALTACQTKVETVEVKVPVYQKAIPPKELLDCPSGVKPPVFLPVEGKPDWVALSPEGQALARDLWLAQKGCIEAWRAWASSPYPFVPPPIPPSAGSAGQP